MNSNAPGGNSPAASMCLRPLAFSSMETLPPPFVPVKNRSWEPPLPQWIAYHGDDGVAWPHEAQFALTGNEGSWHFGITDDDAWAIYYALQDGRAIIAGTDAYTVSSNLITNHAYAVVGLSGDGTWDNLWVLVRNPWGVDGGEPSGDPNDGLVWVRWSDFKASMIYIDVQ